MAAPSSADIGALVVDPALLRKYPFGATRHPSYPAADRFAAAFGPADALRQLSRRGASDGQEPVSVYLYLPFCETACLHCARTTVVTRDHGQVTQYLSYLEREIVTQRGALGRDEQVARLRWSGGTATFLAPEELMRLWEVLNCYFAFAAGGEFSIDLDPRQATPPTIERLAALGFNCMTLAVHDFDPAVQARINRVHSAEEAGHAMMAARAAGFGSVSVDLLLGLPGQSARSMAATIDTTLRMRPDRIALHSFEHRPAQYVAQREIDAGELPFPVESIRILALAVEALTGAGYVCCGAGRFELPGCERLVARPGAAPRPDCGDRGALARLDRLGFGLSAISAVGNAYSQNHCTLENYYASLERGELPVSRGRLLTGDDLVRREVIRRLAWDFRLSFDELGARFGIDFGSHFSAERERLAELERDGLVALSPAGIEATPLGRLLIGNVCMTFDRYLRAAPSEERETGSRRADECRRATCV